MARRHMGTRLVVVIAALGLGLPLMMGQGCLRPRAPLTVGAGGDLTTTVGTPIQLEAVISGGTAPYTVTWEPSAGLDDASLQEPTFTPTETGSFTFTVTVQDAAGDQDSDSVTVTVNNAGTNGTDGDGNAGTAQTAPLAVDAGPDVTVTVGNKVTLQGAYTGGVGPYTIVWSPAGQLSNTSSLTPSFTPTTIGVFTFTLKVTDGEDSIDEDSVIVTSTDLTTLKTLTWGANYSGQGYQLLAEFTQPVDKATAERVSNYRTSSGDTVPASATLSADGKKVTLIFTAVQFTAKSKFDIGVGDGILDANGGRVPAAKGLTPLANASDTSVPKASTIRWAVDYDDGYGLDLVFNEAMDQASVESARAYRVTDAGSSAVGFDAVLGDDARTVSLVFHGLALSQAAKLDIGLLSLRDINGRLLVAANGNVIAANSLDLDAPLIVKDSVRFVGNYAGGGYQVTLEFNEAMDRTSAQGASAYKIDGLAATSATLDSEGRKVTLAWSSGTFSSSSKLSILGGSVKDINGRSLAAQTNLAIAPASSTGGGGGGGGTVPSPPVLTWLKGSESTAFQFRALFNEAMDKASVENTANWGITGTDIHPTSVVLSTQTAGDDIAGRTALVTFSDFGTSNQRMSRTSKVDISIGNSIANVNGSVLPEVSRSIDANAGDITAPALAIPKTGLVAKPVWGDVIAAAYSGNIYTVSLVFNETMDGASATDRTNYYLLGMHPTSVKMDGTGRKLVLVFTTTSGPIGLADKLEILPNVRDINGHTVSIGSAIGIQSDPDDQTPPAVVNLFWGTQRGPYQVTITFDEVLDAASATTLSAYRLASFIPTEAQILADGKTVNLTFGTAMLVSTDDFDILGNVFDINGRAYDHSRDAVLPGAPIGLPLDDTMPPAVAEAVWAVDSLDYRVLVTFDEAVSMDTASNPALYSAGSGFFLTPAASAQLLPGGTTVELVFTQFGLLNPPFDLTADLRIQTDFGAGGLTGVTDMHGNISTRARSVPIKFNELDMVGVGMGFFDPPTATWMPDVDLGMYSLRVTFALEVLDRASAENTANYRITDSDPPINPIMAMLALADDLPNGVFAGRTVFLDFAVPLSAASMLDASVGGSVVDMSNNGIPEAVEIMISADPADVTVPTIDSIERGPLQGEWTVVYSETMDWDTATAPESYLLTADTPDGPVEYAPTGVWLDDDGMTAYVQFSLPNEEIESAVLHIEGPTDINGLPVAAFDLLVDDIPPTVVSAQITATPGEWIVTFSEPMDPVTATDVGSYVINVMDDSDPPAVINSYSPTTVTLSEDGLTATVQFPAIPDNELQGAILHIEGPTDIKGNPLEPFDLTIDTVAPTVLSADPLPLVGIWYITFSEPMDPVSATDLDNYVITKDPDEYSPIEAAISEDGTMVLLLFTVPVEDLGGGVLHIEGPTDLIGNPVEPFDLTIPAAP